MRESEIQKQIMAWLKASGILHWRVNLGAVKHTGVGRRKNQMKGFPDIAGVLSRTDGRLFTIEVKTKTAPIMPEQHIWRARLEERGVVYILARSLDDVECVLKSYEGERA